MISLDTPPAWFANQATDHLDADAARKYAGTDGERAWYKLIGMPPTSTFLFA